VLVVDDEPLVARAASRLLAREHEITIAHSGAEALERIQRGEPFDLVLCDLMMPGVSGMDFHQRLSKLCPDLAARTVFVSGGVFTEDARSFLASGGHPCVEKPFDVGVLREAVNRALGEPSSGGS
jgi:CheY-like chemotaxis protein